MLAGPGSISFLIGMYDHYTMIFEKIITIFALLGVCLATFHVLKSSHYIVKMLGASGINAISGIIGFGVIAVGIEYISSSVITVLRSALN